MEVLPVTTRYLVIQLARFGDLIQTKRLILALARNGEVHLCVDRSLKQLAELVYPFAIVHDIAAHGAGASSSDLPLIASQCQQCFSTLSELSFAKVYNLNFSPLNYVMARLFDPSTVSGYVSLDYQPAKDRWATMAFRLTKNRRLGALNLVDFWGWMATEPCAPEKVNPVAKPKGEGVGVVLAGRNQRRSLPPPLLARVVAAIRTRFKGEPVFLLGSNSERGAGKDLVANLPSTLRKEVKNLAGQTGWRDLHEVVSGLSTLVTPDTGTMHLAAHLGVPIQAFFLSSAWCFETGPYGAGHTVWQATHECAPCVESQPCPCATACRAPFESTELLKILQGRAGVDNPEGIARLESGFDSLGVRFDSVGSEMPMANEREKMRRFLMYHLETDQAGVSCASDLAMQYYHEKDWTTPDLRELSTVGENL